MLKKKKKILYTLDAKREITQAKEWSLKTHGRKKTKEYFGALFANIEALGKGTKQGRNRATFYSNVFLSLRSGQHLIYYFETDEILVIVSVLHDAQNAPERLANREAIYEKLGPENYSNRVAAAATLIKNIKIYSSDQRDEQIMSKNMT